MQLTSELNWQTAKLFKHGIGDDAMGVWQYAADIVNCAMKADVRLTESINELIFWRH